MNKKSSTKPAHDSGEVKGAFLLVFMLIAVLIAGSGYSYFLYHKRIVVAEKYKELAAIADLKADQISQWRKEHLSSGSAIFTNPLISNGVAKFLAAEDAPKAQKEIQTWLTDLHEKRGYTKAALLRPDGTPIIVIPTENRPEKSDTVSRVSQAVRTQQVMLSDFHRDYPAGPIHLDLIIPIITHLGTVSRCDAVLALVINPKIFLYPLLQSWPSPNQTAETILVEREGDHVLFLNELRYRKDAALTFRLPLSDKKLPAVRAALGEEGVFKGKDYRGETVLTATRNIAGSPWAILTKIDTREIFKPISRRAKFVASICLMTALVAGLSIDLWWMRKKEAHLQQQYETELQHNIDLKQAKLSLHLAHFELEQRVSERTADLTKANTQLQHEMAERKQLELKLVGAKQLETVGQLAGGVAHEVRNPLNAILSITEALFKEEEIENRPEYEPYIQHIRTQVNRLAHLMNDLLDLGKAIPDSSLQPMPLHELCHDTIILWKSSGMAINRQVELSCAEGAESLLVMADGMKLQQVVFNLLENAGQHNPAGSAVLLQIEQASGETPPAGMATIRIIDRGAGIADDRIARVFEPFYSDRKGGTGLGLALVKHFTEHMGGIVRIFNNYPYAGCTAEVHIPLSTKDSI